MKKPVARWHCRARARYDLKRKIGKKEEEEEREDFDRQGKELKKEATAEEEHWRN